MKRFLRQLLLGKITKNDQPRLKINPIQKRILNIRAIWNNDHQDDNGIEKIFRLFLSISQLIFPGIYIKYWVSKRNFEYLLFLNYLEIVCAFAVLYTLGDNMNRPFIHWFDSIYFSIITSNSVGYGDFYPITTFAKVLVSIQAMFFLSFVVLFLNFFSSKVKSKGYFDHESEI
jgi:voltage-gated potassium channel